MTSSKINDVSICSESITDDISVKDSPPQPTYHVFNELSNATQHSLACIVLDILMSPLPSKDIANFLLDNLLSPLPQPYDRLLATGMIFAKLPKYFYQHLYQRAL